MATTSPRLQRRTDPASRNIDGMHSAGDLRNKDPKKRYVWVNKLSEDLGPGYYEHIGYTVERSGPGAPVPAMGRTSRASGEVIEFRGMQLMSIQNEEWEELERAGEYGQSGQALIDEREEQIIKRRGGMIDPFRGIHANKRPTFVDFENKTQRSV